MAAVAAMLALSRIVTDPRLSDPRLSDGLFGGRQGAHLGTLD
jgi:hypothetical protein